MKHLIKMTALLATLMVTPSLMAQEITQAQKDGSARLVSECAIKYAPANWDLITVILDRTDPKKVVIYNNARITNAKGEKQLVDIDVSKCDINKQVNDLLKFQAILPTDQANWKSLVFQTNSKGGYEVFTNIAWERMLAKQKAANQKKSK